MPLTVKFRTNGPLIAGKRAGGVFFFSKRNLGGVEKHLFGDKVVVGPRPLLLGPRPV